MSGRRWRGKRKQPCAHVCDELAVTCGGHPDPKEGKKGGEKRHAGELHAIKSWMMLLVQMDVS